MKSIVTTKQKDHTTLAAKVRLRRELLDELVAPLVLETHGGWGRVYERVWYRAAGGLVIERDESKAEHLARNRRGWAVYQADCEKALAAGLGAGRSFDIVDLDPYGATLPALVGLFKRERRFPDRWHIVANDGARLKARLGGAWHVHTLRSAVPRFGNDLAPRYLEVLRFAIGELARPAGFDVVYWRGYYCGHGDQMTHYRAKLERR